MNKLVFKYKSHEIIVELTFWPVQSTGNLSIHCLVKFSLVCVVDKEGLEGNLPHFISNQGVCAHIE